MINLPKDDIYKLRDIKDGEVILRKTDDFNVPSNSREHERHLLEYFGTPIITLPQFKKFINLSNTTFYTMRRQQNLPRMIPITDGSGEVRILVFDLACWGENGGNLKGISRYAPDGTRMPGRGRKPKLPKSEPLSESEKEKFADIIYEPES